MNINSHRHILYVTCIVYYIPTKKYAREKEMLVRMLWLQWRENTFTVKSVSSV